MLRYLASHNFFKMHERPVLNQLRLRREKNRSRLQKTGLVRSGPVFCLSGRMIDRSRSRSFLKRQKDRDRTGLLITTWAYVGCHGRHGPMLAVVGGPMLALAIVALHCLPWPSLGLGVVGLRWLSWACGGGGGGGGKGDGGGEGGGCGCGCGCSGLMFPVQSILNLLHRRQSPGHVM